MMGYSVFCFLWDGVLVDSGFLHAWDALRHFLKGKRVDVLLHTHAHEDHAGNSAAIIRTKGADAPAPGILAEALAHPERDHYRWFRTMTWGAPPEPCLARIMDGDVVSVGNRRFRYVPTPGHCPAHHVVFEETTRTMFTGDLYLAPVVRFASRHEDLGRTIASLRKAAALEPEIMFDSHLGALDDPIRRLNERADNMEAVQDRVLELDAQGLEPREITRLVLGNENHLSWITRGDFKKQNVVWSFLKGKGGV
ncbi:MAG: MBL fold metallo-hydrolase [Deltaproteobacteria bacterium]|nr:MBL fold metallo-hydrolase [Deltaproteobacteria bacterium]